MAVESFFNAETKWFVEFDEAPSKILAHHWPHVPNLGDVTKVDWAQVEPVDIITGGSPCQDLSQAGRRRGMTEGTRSNLWVNMREAIAKIRPKLVVWENVQGALSAKATSDSDMEPGEGQVGNGGGGHLRALGRVLGDLAEIGYDARWTTVRASDVGAPHRRARVFLVAWPQASSDTSGVGSVAVNDGPGCAEACGGGDGWPDGSGGSPLISDPEGGGWDHGQAPDDGQTNREVNTSRDNRDIAADTSSVGLQARHIGTCGYGPQVSRANSGGETLSHPIGKRWNGRGATPVEAEGPHPATNRHSSGIEWGEYAPAVRRWERIVGQAPAPTEPNTKGNPRLNAAFAEWMMGLPAGHITSPEIGLSRADQLKAIGNGVCPQQAFAALELLMGIDEELV